MSGSEFERENIVTDALSADPASKPFEPAREHTWRPPGEADVGGEDELAARTASSAPKGADRHRPRPAESDQQVRPMVERGARRRQRVERGLVGRDVVMC